MEKLIDLKAYPVQGVLPLLLKDKTTKKNIIWATDTYKDYGRNYQDQDPMFILDVCNHAEAILPRIAKTSEDQAARTRKKAEVFTPVWLCCQMNNYLDEDWFGRKDVFNVLHNDHTWDVNENPIDFPKGKSWKKYVDSRRLEITCGEAPFLVSRYDAASGELIVPPKRRIGLLDRKLRIVNENTANKTDWTTWATRAFQSVYGYEYQGDNLLIARINLLNTFVDYYSERWNEIPPIKDLKTIVNVICWNIWQMDGLTDRVPAGKIQTVVENRLFDATATDPDMTPYCKIQDWRADHPVIFHELKDFEGPKIQEENG